MVRGVDQLVILRMSPRHPGQQPFTLRHARLSEAVVVNRLAKRLKGETKPIQQAHQGGRHGCTDSRNAVFGGQFADAS